MTPATVCFPTQLRRTGRVIKSNPAPIPRGRGHELSNRLYEFLDVRIVAFEAALKFGQFGHDLPICCQGFAHAHESAHDKDAHLYGALGIQHRGCHDCTVLGEGVGQVTPVAARSHQESGLCFA